MGKKPFSALTALLPRHVRSPLIELRRPSFSGVLQGQTSAMDSGSELASSMFSSSGPHE